VKDMYCREGRRAEAEWHAESAILIADPETRCAGAMRNPARAIEDAEALAQVQHASAQREIVKEKRAHAAAARCSYPSLCYHAAT